MSESKICFQYSYLFRQDFLLFFQLDKGSCSNSSNSGLLSFLGLLIRGLGLQTVFFFNSRSSLLFLSLLQEFLHTNDFLMICSFVVSTKVTIIITILFGVQRGPTTKVLPMHLMQELLVSVSCINVHGNWLNGWGNEGIVRNGGNGGYSKSNSPGPSLYVPLNTLAHNSSQPHAVKFECSDQRPLRLAHKECW